jgi:precorrin-2 dehydrogenase/sirohydrochlorin ferrochelatase
MQHHQLYFPVALNITNKKCIVIGGGKIALRKVKSLLEFGANVVVISPRVCDGLNKLITLNKIKVLRREFHRGDLKGSFLVIAATSKYKTNLRIAEEARREHVYVNVVDNPVICDFIMTSYFRRKKLIVAISTSGLSPALAKKLRMYLQKIIGKEYGDLVELIEDMRILLKNKNIKAGSRKWQQALNLEILISHLKNKRSIEARNLVLDKLGISGDQLE